MENKTITPDEFSAWLKTATLEEKQKIAAAMANPVKNCRFVYPKRHIVAGGYGPYKKVVLR